MKDSKRAIKEANIIEAAERVFAVVGFKNAKMEDIAAEAGITKVTLYSYFQSKENLYLAITYKSLQLLIDEFYRVIEKNKTSPGLDYSIAILESFMNFCEDNYLYSEVLLDYFAMIRSTSGGMDETKLTEATKESIYYMKLQGIQNLPFKLTAREIERGQKDGSVLNRIDPMFQTLFGWSMSIGYVKLIAASGESPAPLFNVGLTKLKDFNLNLASHLLSNNMMQDQLEKNNLI